jgi:outer membrane protein
VKKIIFILSILTAGSLNQVSAQKFGHVNATEIMLLMPEMKRVEHVLDSFQTVLDNDLKLEYERYQKIEEKLKTQMAANLSEKLIQLTQQELQGQYENIQRKQQAYEQEVSEKQNLLIKPLNDKILKAIKDVCTEKGLNYVFDISKGALVYWDEKDDVNKEVRKKLGIAEDAKLPQNATNNNK